MHELLNTEPWKSKIQEAIGKYLTVEFVETIMQRAFQKALSEMRDR